MIFYNGEVEERGNTGVLQVMRQERVKNNYLSGVMGSTLVSLRKEVKIYGFSKYEKNQSLFR